MNYNIDIKTSLNHEKELVTSQSFKEKLLDVLANLIKLSDDPHHPIAAIVFENNKIIGSGNAHYIPDNNVGYIFPNEKIPARSIMNTKYPYMIHAEMDAITQCKTNIQNASIIVTYFPCNECAKLIIASGIKEVIYTELPDLTKERYILANILFTIAGVKTYFIDEYFK